MNVECHTKSVVCAIGYAHEGTNYLVMSCQRSILSGFPSVVVPAIWMRISGGKVCDAEPPPGLHTLNGYMKNHANYANVS